MFMLYWLNELKSQSCQWKLTFSDQAAEIKNVKFNLQGEFLFCGDL